MCLLIMEAFDLRFVASIKASGYLPIMLCCALCILFLISLMGLYVCMYVCMYAFCLISCLCLYVFSIHVCVYVDIVHICYFITIMYPDSSMLLPYTNNVSMYVCTYSEVFTLLPLDATHIILCHCLSLYFVVFLSIS